MTTGGHLVAALLGAAQGNVLGETGDAVVQDAVPVCLRLAKILRMIANWLSRLPFLDGACSAARIRRNIRHEVVLVEPTGPTMQTLSNPTCMARPTLWRHRARQDHRHAFVGRAWYSWRWVAPDIWPYVGAPHPAHGPMSGAPSPGSCAVRARLEARGILGPTSADLADENGRRQAAALLVTRAMEAVEDLRQAFG